MNVYAYLSIAYRSAAVTEDRIQQGIMKAKPPCPVNRLYRWANAQGLCYSKMLLRLLCEDLQIFSFATC